MNYVGEVSDLLLTRCSELTMLSPTDFVTIAEWEKQEIPLTVVLISINRICEERQGKGITSVEDIQERVKEDYTNWLLTKGSLPAELDGEE